MANDIERLAGSWSRSSPRTSPAGSETISTASIPGYIGITREGRFFGLVTPDQQKTAHTVEEQAAAYRAMLAYTGKLALDGGKFIVTVDLAWNREWVGTEQVRFWRVDGDQLLITSAPFPNPNVAGSMVIGTLIWQREP